jgi:hypothetical protein
MKNFLFTILTTFVLVGSQSCGKDSDEFIPVNTKIDTIQTAKKETDWQEDLLKINDISTNVLPPLGVEKLMAELAADPTKHELSAERGGIIVTPDNVSLEFPANSCVTENNRPCTGTLKVEVLVLRKKGEFLLNNVPTISGGKQLISGGAVLVKIKQDDDVKLARNASYKVKFQPATAIEDGMKLFEGKFEGRFKFDWNLISTSPNTANAPIVRTWADSTQGRRTTGYELLLDRFSWINCDRFSGDSTTLTNKFCVALPDTFTNQNCSVFAVFKDINSVVALAGDGRTKQFCVPSSYRGLPVGRVINIITIASIKDRIYIGKKEATISANATITVVPVLTTKAGAKDIISNL